MCAWKQQTNVVDRETIRIGSVKLEIRPYSGVDGDYVDVGALRGATFREIWTDVLVKSDNAGILDEGITDHVVEINGELFEINVVNLGIAFAGIGTDAVVTTAEKTILDPRESVALTDYDLSELLHKMGSGEEVTAIIVYSLAAGGTTYVRDCDYVVVTKADGHTAIARAFATEIKAIAGDDTVAVAAGDAGTGTYTVAGADPGDWLKMPAVGDHVTFTGLDAEKMNNGVKLVTAVTANVITVNEECELEAALAGVGCTRGGIATPATVYVTYKYVPLTSRTYTAGGKTSKSALKLRMTNKNIDNLDWVMLVHKAYIGDGLNLVFPADDDPNPMPCPIKFIGRLDALKGSGDQLFKITDSQDTD